MIYRRAAPEDGKEMLRLIESHPARGGMKILYTRRPDAYQSYLTECPDAEIFVCAGENNHISAQIVCLPRKMYIDRKVETIGYITGLYKEENSIVNILKLLEEGRPKSAAKQFFCSILDDNKPVFDLFSKHKMIHPICDYKTYFIHPSALKPPKHNFSFRRAAPYDAERLVEFYKRGSDYSYQPFFKTMNDFANLTVSDFFLLEDNNKIIAAGALWNQQAYKQYIALGYRGIYYFASLANPILNLFHYPSLPKINTAADFAYISFMLYHKDNLDAARIFLGEIAKEAQGCDFLTVGAEALSEREALLNTVRNIKIGSKICRIGSRGNNTGREYDAKFRFECALL